MMTRPMDTAFCFFPKMTPVLFEVSITECETSKVTVQILSPKAINASFQIIQIEGEKEVRGVLYQSCW